MPSGSIRFFYTTGSNYTMNDLPEENYKWGLSIVMKRLNSSCTVILFPETKGKPMVNYWLALSKKWTGWKDFASL